MKSFFSFLFACLIAMPFAEAQNVPAKAELLGTFPKPVYVPSLAEQIQNGTFIAADPNEPLQMGRPKRSGANITVPGKGLPKGNDALVETQNRAAKKKGREPELVFNAHVSNITPSDPTGAAGPNHYIGGWNTSFQIFDKQGGTLVPNASLSTLFPGNNLGDPIVLYDAAADRFIITEFDSSPNGFNFAICQGPDPVNDGWYVYTTGMTTGSFPDYPKFSIWSDGYYVTANIGSTNKVFVIERDSVLVGATPRFVGFPLTGIRTSGFYSPQAFSVSNHDLPAPGNATIVYLQDDAWSGVTEDHLKLWSINMDWENVGSSTISAAVQLPTTPFISVFDGGSFSNRPQPSGPNIDVLQATIMQQAQFRRFEDHNAVVFNFVVDTDGTSGELAGIRWFELRQTADGEPWEIYQEGTYISPYNNKDAFSGSMAMDANGNIGMGYTTVSTQEKIAIYYTGRFASDPLGAMTVDETLIAQGNSNDPSNRLADYVHLTVDPADDMSFWHIAEYFNNNQRTDVVGKFKIAAEAMNDVGVVALVEPVSGELSSEQPVTVSIFNYGQNEQIDIPVSFQLDGGDVVTEIFAGPLSAAETADYTFTATADMGVMGQTYTLAAFTSLDGDESTENDTLVSEVTYLNANDIGVTAVLSPESGTGLTNEETVTVSVSNFGSMEQSSFELHYDVDGTIVTETYTETLAPLSSAEYSFETPADLFNLGDYVLATYTSLPDDGDMTNDTTTVVVSNSNCQPESDCSSGDAIFKVVLRDLNNSSECSPNGYSDFTDLMTNIETESTNELILTVGFGDEFVKVWIDFNDNFVFEENELVVNDHEIADGMGAGMYTDTLEIQIAEDALLGEHLMRIKTNWNATVPLDACEATEMGETEDYKVNVILTTGNENLPEINSSLQVRPYGNNQFELSFVSEKLDDMVLINLHNSLGMNLVENKVTYANGRYTYHLDMSYAAAGVYVVRMGTHKYGRVQKIIVQ